MIRINQGDLDALVGSQLDLCGGVQWYWLEDPNQVAVSLLSRFEDTEFIVDATRVALETQEDLSCRRRTVYAMMGKSGVDDHDSHFRK